MVGARGLLLVCVAACYDPRIPGAEVKGDAQAPVIDVAEAADGSELDGLDWWYDASLQVDAVEMCPAPPAGCTSTFRCGGACYTTCEDDRTWGDARAVCEGWSSQLASITTHDENLCIFYGTPFTVAWIGLFQLSGSGEPAVDWQWVSGETFAYDNWDEGEPNDANVGEDCATINLNNGDDASQWNDDGCGESKDFVCERAL